MHFLTVKGVYLTKVIIKKLLVRWTTWPLFLHILLEWLPYYYPQTWDSFVTKTAVTCTPVFSGYQLRCLAYVRLIPNQGTCMWPNKEASRLLLIILITSYSERTCVYAICMTQLRILLDYVRLGM